MFLLCERVYFSGTFTYRLLGTNVNAIEYLEKIGYEYNILEQQMLKLFFNKRHRDERPEIVKNIYGYLQMFMS